MENVDLIELLINDDDVKSGVEYMAFVDKPATERNWHVFNEQHLFKITDEERRIVMGPLIVANQPIYRVRDGKTFYVVFSAETINKIVKKFMRNGFISNVNEMHDMNRVADDCYMIESFIIDSSRGIKTPEGFGELPEGSWFGTYQVDNDDVWSKIKEGKFRGFSVEGAFSEEKIDEVDEALAEAIVEELLKQ